MVEANRFAICFLSVISFPLTFKWPEEEVDFFFPLIILIAFQTVLGLVFDVSEEQKLCQDVFFWVFIVCLALAFSCLKASTFSAERFQKSFRWAFLLSLIACLQTSLNHGTFWSLFLEMWDFGMVWFAISIKVFVNWATGSSDRASSSDNRDIQRARKDIRSALSNFQCSAAGSSSLREVFRMTGKWSLPPVKFQCKRWVTDRYIRIRKGVITVVSVCRFTSV